MEPEELDPDPIRQFRAWYADAGSDSVCLATSSATGAPSARMVLLKGVSPAGFVFYSNRTSAKGRDLSANARAALVFHWPPDRQVRVRGPVEEVPDHESDAYWVTRSRGSQLGAWASEQSTVISGRDVLEARLAAVGERFAGAEVPRPSHWGGYRVAATEIEFWHHRDDRLHDRILYVQEGQVWVRRRLSP